jgi:hypothetical protein
MPFPTTYLDTEGAVRDWVNAQTGLVGAGHPLPLGAHLKRLRSPFRGSYVLLSRVGGSPDPTEEVNVDQALISGSVYGTTKQGAALAAAAYANLLASATGLPAAVTGGRLIAVTAITGPNYIPDGDEERYLVDGVFLIQPL